MPQTLPMPPLEMRALVGPTNVEVFDNQPVGPSTKSSACPKALMMWSSTSVAAVADSPANCCNKRQSRNAMSASMFTRHDRMGDAELHVDRSEFHL